jgi:maltose-binding protein MalE
MRDEYGTLRQLEPNITIWASPETENVLEAFQAEFSATFGVTATFESRFIDSELERHFLEADEGPDILVGAHDWVGNLVANDAVEPINLTDTCRREFDGVEWALDALSCEGLTYALPSSLDTMALLRNLDLAPEAPRTFEELLAFGDALVAEHRAEQPLAIQVGRGGDPFQIWPLIASAGGWLFRRDANGLWNTRDIGIDSPESIVALEKIRELGARGVLRTETTSDIAVQAFARGETPFLFAMSEAVTRAREAGVNIEVTQIPGFADGGPAVPFVAVYGFFVGRRGRNKVIAADLAHDYLSRQDVVEYFGHSGYVVPREDSGDVDPNIAVFHRLCREGDLMPSFPQMRGVWGALGAAEVALIEGGETNSIAHSLATQISELF